MAFKNQGGQDKNSADINMDIGWTDGWMEY